MSVTREAVLDFMINRGFAPFTTADVAHELGAREYQARAAVSWLKLAGYIEPIGWHETREHVKVYRWTGKRCQIYSVRRDAEDRALQNAERQAESMRESAVELDRIFIRMRTSVAYE